MADITAQARRLRDALFHGRSLGRQNQASLRRPTSASVTQVLDRSHAQERQCNEGVGDLAYIVRDHDQLSARNRRWFLGWLVGGVGVAAAVTTGIVAASDGDAAEADKPGVPASNRKYSDYKTYHIDALVDGAWYDPKNLPESVNISDYSVVIKAKALGTEKDTRVFVDKDAIEPVEELIHKAEENDAKYGRLSNSRLHYYPQEINELVQALPGKTIYGEHPDRITLKDCKQAEKDMGKKGGLSEIKGEYGLMEEFK